MSRYDARNLAQRITDKGNPGPILRRHKGTITDINANGTVDLNLDGTTVVLSSIPALTGTFLQVNDVVEVLIDDTDVFVLGKIAASDVYTRAALSGIGGGNLTWDGSTLSGTTRYLWIPAGAGNGGHWNLEGTVDTPSSFSISGIGAWNIVYYRATYEEWASTARVSIQPAEMTVSVYSEYSPHENDLVLGIHSSDDGRFYMADGRVIDKWRNVTFQNSWQNYGGQFETCQYMKDAEGFVHLKGLVKSGSLSAPAFTLPVGYRPPAYIHAASLSNGVVGGVRVEANGNVTLGNPGSSTWFSVRVPPFKAV